MVNFVDQQLKAISDQKEVIDWNVVQSPGIRERGSTVTKMPALPVIQFDLPDDPETVKNKEEND